LNHKTGIWGINSESVAGNVGQLFFKPVGGIAGKLFNTVLGLAEPARQKNPVSGFSERQGASAISANDIRMRHTSPLVVLFKDTCLLHKGIQVNLISNEAN
jgi:hypothetical protein